ncbi:MAG: glycosyltransferase family 2 protein, partial [bacterium]|nr:glycosyltransferase family 2 protein [bacterium]
DSSDNSGEICDEYAKIDMRIRVIHKRNEGVSESRNAGLSIARGKYISFCDGDDVMAPNELQVLFENLHDTNSDLSCCGFVRFEEATPSWNTESYNIKELSDKNDMLRTIISNKTYAGYLWNKLFKSELLKEKYPLKFKKDIAVLEDEVFVLSYLQRCKKICLTDMKLYGYRINLSGVMNQRYSERTVTAILGREKILSICENLKSSPSIMCTVWNKLMKEYSINYKKLTFINIPNRLVWKEQIRKGFLNHLGKYDLDRSWSIKEKVYYYFLWLETKRIC